MIQEDTFLIFLGLYYKTFYGSYCCFIVVSQSVWLRMSLPPYPSLILKKDRIPILAVASCVRLHSSRLLPCLQILDWGLLTVANTLA
jgi:hypothetical protein